MANTFFGPAKEGFLKGEIDWDTAVIKVSLVRGYTPNSAHKFVSEVTAAGGTLHATSSALAGKSATNGVLDANDFTYTAVTTNASNHYLLVYQSSAVTGGADVASSAQRLICYIDTGTNLPVVPNGGDVNIVWDNGANKIVALT
jgi:hypothetical protein